MVSADQTSINTLQCLDGARVDYLTVGCGPPVIVIPGTLSTAADYSIFAAALARDFTVHTIERRGRGGSSPQGKDYGILTECSDVLALQRLTGASRIFGHSYGGLIALEASRGNVNARKVAVYDPGVSVDGSIALDWLEDCERLVAAGKPLDGLARFSIAAGPRGARWMPTLLMKALLPRVVPAERLPKMLVLLPTSLREHEVVGSLDSGHARYREISADVLVMTSGRSGPDYVPKAARVLADVIPSLKVQAFPSLNHFGPDQSGPEEVARAASAFFAY
jgi:pimeloyl-ACP methyl ester carboxylesterase